MSLINEALKRAEADKLQRSPFFDNLTVLPPADEPPGPIMPETAVASAAPPAPGGHPPRASAPPPKRPERLQSPLLAIGGAALVLAAAGGGVWLMWYRAQNQAGPAPAAAAPVALHPPTTARAVHPPRVRVGPEAELAFARTMEALKYYRPSAEHPAPAAPVEEPAPRPQTAPSSRTATRSASFPVEPRTVFNPGGFKLSAVMRGPDGDAAIINNSLIRVGQTIKGAKLVRIEQYLVELEYDGQRFIVRM